MHCDKDSRSRVVSFLHILSSRLDEYYHRIDTHTKRQDKRKIDHKVHSHTEIIQHNERNKEGYRHRQCGDQTLTKSDKYHRDQEYEDS